MRIVYVLQNTQSVIKLITDMFVVVITRAIVQ